MLLATAGVLLMVAIPSVLSQLYAFGGLGGLIKTGYGGARYLVLNSSLTFGTGFEWWLLGSVLLAFCGITFRNTVHFWIGLVLYVGLALILLLIGGRSTLVYTLLFGVALYHYGYRRISSRVVTLGLLVGIGAAQFYALARYYLPGGLLYAVSQTWSGVLRNPLLLAPWTTGEFINPATSLLEILQYGGPHLLFGASYFPALGGPIPFVARLFAQVGFDPNAWRLQRFHPEVLAAGGGLGFSPVTEGYMNFGVLGIVGHMFLYGYSIGWIYRRLSTNSSTSMILLFAGSLPAFMLDGMRINTTSFMYKWTRSYLMPWIIFVVLELFFRTTTAGATRPARRPANG